MTELPQLAQQLASAEYQGHRFQCLPIAGVQPVLRVEVSELDSLPIYITRTETQIICLAYLAHHSEIRSDSRDKFNQLLLELNVPMPLSAFALVEDYYVLFGALAVDSELSLLLTELVTLAENAEQVLSYIEDYLA